MIKIENDCVGCPTYCINCGNKEVPHFYCDECEEEVNEGELFLFDNKQLCEECLKNQFHRVTAEDYDYDEGFY